VAVHLKVGATADFYWLMRYAVRIEIASFAVIVDAKDEVARNFYERESFLPLSEGDEVVSADGGFGEAFRKPMQL
jgi:hypothetical protein